MGRDMDGTKKYQISAENLQNKLSNFDLRNNKLLQCLAGKQDIGKLLIHESTGKIKSSMAQKRIEKEASKELSMSNLDFSLKMPTLATSNSSQFAPKLREAETRKQTNSGCYTKVDCYLKSLKTEPMRIFEVQRVSDHH